MQGLVDAEEFVDTAWLAELDVQFANPSARCMLTPQYTDYIALNGPTASLIDDEKRELNVRLLGEVLPPAASLEDMVAAWGLIEARSQAWNHGEALWHLRDVPEIASGYLDGLDGLTTFGNKALLVPLP